MTPAERAAVHALAGAFGRLSLAAELVAQAKPGPARAALVERMEAARKLALAEFAAAQDALAQESGGAVSTHAADESAPSRMPPAAARGEAATEMSSAEPSASPPPGPASTPLRAAQTPVPSTTKPVAPGAGDGRAVPAPKTYAPRPGSIGDVALQLASKGPFSSLDLARATKSDVSVCATICNQLRKRGLLVFSGITPAERMRGVRGTYSLPSSEPGPAPSKSGGALGRALVRAGEPAADPDAELARYGVRRLAPEQAAKSEPRAAVTGVHRSVAEFFADKPALPLARPVTPRPWL